MPLSRGNMDEAGNRAALALAGIRPVGQAVLSTTAGAEFSHTVANAETRRVIVFHASGVDTDIRVANVSAIAVVTDMPVASGVYFVMEAYVGESISVWNASAGVISVYVMEIQ